MPITASSKVAQTGTRPKKDPTLRATTHPRLRHQAWFRLAWKALLLAALCCAGFFFELHALRKLTFDNPNPAIAQAYRKHRFDAVRLLAGLGREVALDSRDAWQQWRHPDARPPLPATVAAGRGSVEGVGSLPPTDPKSADQTHP